MKQIKFLRSFYTALTVIGIIVAFGFANLPTRNLEVTFLDVGQGDAILIRTPQNQKILVDAGPAGKILPSLSKELNFFERKIDLIVLTHPDTDHVAGFVEVLKRFEVKNVLLTGVRHETKWYAEILAQIYKQQIPVFIANAEDDFKFGEVALDVFWPNESFVARSMEDANAISVSMRVVFGETAVVLTGDLDVASEKEIVATSQNLKAQVFKLGHHGSKTSNSDEFLSAVNPEIVIVSAGKDNKFGHPSPKILRRVWGLEVLETSELGNVKLVSDGLKWK